VLDDPAVYVWGGEAVLMGGEPVGELSSAGWSPKAGACMALGWVRGAVAAQAHAGTPVQIDLWGRSVGATAWTRWPAWARPG
jgi:4-methylaminobutanoate oxidase (formaldehyde-forming)